MSFEYLCRCICDGCGARSREGPGEFAMDILLRQSRWRTIRVACYGNEVNYCPACAEGKTDRELLATIGLLPSEE